jgi:beta-phosphoglucomutase
MPRVQYRGMVFLGAIFDVDGVLVDSTEAHFAAWHAMGRRIGVPYPRALFERTFGMHNRQTIPLWLGREVDEAERERLAGEKEALYRQAARNSLRPIPGVVEFVRALTSAQFRLAVGSSGPAANVHLALDIVGLAEVFEAISSGDDVTEGKPHPAIFLNAARKLAIDPKDCVVFEDAPQGIEAAHAGEMTAVALPTSRSPEQLKKADYVAKSFFELTPAGVRAFIEARQRGGTLRDSAM